MLLKKCYVSSFGKLKDFSIDFSDGFNVIKEDNGWGKTTLATFIKVMFYGIDNGRKTISESDRKKYKPWNSIEKFGGYIEFLKDAKPYRLERYFGNKEAEDSVCLTDLTTGKIYNTQVDWGLKTFGIDEDGFKSTTYLGQKDFEIKSNASITQKFHALFNEENKENFDEAVKILEDKAKKLLPNRGENGLIPHAKSKIHNLKEESIRLKQSFTHLKDLKKRMGLLDEQILILEGEIKKLNTLRVQASDQKAIKIKKERYQDCLNKIEQIKLRILEIEKVIGSNFISQAEIDDYSEIVKEYKRNVEAIRNLEKNVEELSSVIETKKQNKSYYFLLPIIALIFAIFPIFAFDFIKIVGTISSLVVSTYCIVLFVLNLTIRKNKDNGNYNSIIENNLSEIKNYKDINEKYIEKINQFFSRFVIDGDFEDRLTKLKEFVKEKDNLRVELEVQSDLLSKYGADPDVKSELKVDGLDIDYIDQQINVKNFSLKQLNSELSSLKTSAVLTEEDANKLSDVESELEQVQEELQTLEKEYKIIKKTLECLIKAQENLKIKYKEPLESSFRKYLSKLTEAMSEKVGIDVDMQVTVSENGGVKDTVYYSKGYQDVFEICKRFALIDVLFTEEKPFIILDDPFCNLDDVKIKNALNLLTILSKEYQIIYFICHDSRGL